LALGFGFLAFGLEDYFSQVIASSDDEDAEPARLDAAAKHANRDMPRLRV
jgi:hypothetical protein